MMLTIWRTQFVAFIAIYCIHSLNFFNALAAPVSVSPQAPSLLRKQELLLNHPSHIPTRQDVHFRDNNLFRRAALQNVLVSNEAEPVHGALKVSAAREPQPVRRRGMFSGITNAVHKIGSGISHAAQKVGNAVKKAGGAVKQAVQKVGNGVKHAVKNVAQKAGNVVKQAVHKVKSGIKQVAQKASSGIRQAAQKVKSGITHAVQKVGNSVKQAAQGVKKVAQKVGNAVKKVAQPVMQAASWVNKNRASIAKGAKIGLKVMSTVTSVAGRVANFLPIPGAGKALSKGLKVASSAMDKGSDAIPGNLGSFGKAMSVMDKIQHPIDGPAGEVLDAILKREGVDISP